MDRLGKDSFVKQPRNSAYLVWLWFVLSTSLGAVGFFLFTLNATTPVPASWGVTDGARDGIDQWLNALIQYLLSPALVSLLGALILTRRPGHAIGRLFVSLGSVMALMALAQEWSVFAYFTVAQPLPGAALAAWFTNWIWLALFTLLLWTAAIFPNGRFLSAGWGRFLGLAIFLFAVPLLIGAMIETPMTSVFQLPNPFVAHHPEAFYNFVFTVSVTAMPLATLGVLVSAIVRFRQSQARERQQMKWLMAGVGFMAVLTVAGLGITFGLRSYWGGILVNAAVIGPALGVGFALLRHQLYDIDILIRRTLQYSVLTGLLALVYFGSIILFQSVFASFGQQSEVAIVITTLAIAALFNPLRIRVQDFIDRRFYRKKYNAEQALAQFATIVRDEVDMDKLTTALIGVVEETVQPEKVSVWLIGESVDRSKRNQQTSH